MEAALTSKGQMTIPKAARDHLHVAPGGRVKIFLHPNGTIVLVPKQPATAIKGIFAGRVSQPVSLDEMGAAIEAGATGEISE